MKRASAQHQATSAADGTAVIVDAAPVGAAINAAFVDVVSGIVASVAAAVVCAVVDDSAASFSALCVVAAHAVATSALFARALAKLFVAQLAAV